MVCCWHTWTSNTWTSCMQQTWNCRAQLCCWPAAGEDDAARRPLQLNVNRCMMTLRCWRHSAQERTSSVHTQIALKVLDASQVPTTSPIERMPDQLFTLHKSALLQCGPWCTSSWMNGRSQTSLPQLKNRQTGYHLLPTPWNPMGDYDSAWIPRTWMMQSRGTTTKPWLWKKSPTS